MKNERPATIGTKTVGGLTACSVWDVPVCATCSSVFLMQAIVQRKVCAGRGVVLRRLR